MNDMLTYNQCFLSNTDINEHQIMWFIRKCDLTFLKILWKRDMRHPLKSSLSRQTRLHNSFSILNLSFNPLEMHGPSFTRNSLMLYRWKRIALKRFGFRLIIWQLKKSHRLGNYVPPKFHEEPVNEAAEPGNEVIDFNQANGTRENRRKGEKQTAATELLCDALKSWNK